MASINPQRLKLPDGSVVCFLVRDTLEEIDPYLEERWWLMGHFNRCAAEIANKLMQAEADKIAERQLAGPRPVKPPRTPVECVKPKLFRSYFRRRRKA